MILKIVIKNAKYVYYQKLFNKCNNNIKKTWDNIRSIINKSPKKNVLPEHVIKDGNICLTNNTDIANEFNNFFTNIGPKFASQIDTSNKRPFESYLYKIKDNLSFKFHMIQEKNVLEIIKSMQPKSSCGFDGFNCKLIKCCASSLVKPLTLIINQSLTTGIFPDQLKTAKVIPIYKENNLDHNILNNYRPISILPVLSKIFEKIVHIQVYDYFSKNKLFFNSQYGFRENHSTELAAIELVDKIYQSLDIGKNPLAVFCDLSKAFDTLDHKILLHKLKFYGFSKIAMNWFFSYLSNRSQFVTLNNTNSSNLKITTGVPQGSILGPLLFLIYVNDLSFSTNSNVIMYADDTCLLIPLTQNSSSINYTNQNNEINDKMSSLYNWLCVNKLSLNIDKTKYMIFHFCQKKLSDDLIPKIIINNKPICKVDKFKFLGFYFDSTLSWKTHIEYISNKISKVNGILSILKYYLPNRILLMIYNSLILSHLNYGILLWGFGNYHRLETLQKQAFRHINKSPYKSHTTPIAKKYKILFIKDIFNISCLKFFYKFKKNMLPLYYYYPIFIQLSYHSRHSSRSVKLPSKFDDCTTSIPLCHPTIPIPLSNRTTSSKCVRYEIPKLLSKNLIPTNIFNKIETHSLNSFIHSSKKFILSSYDSICTISNCFICSKK